MAQTANLPRNDDGTLAAYAWPGGYPLFYVCRDGGVLCPECAQNEDTHDTCPPDASRCREGIEGAQWCLVGADVHWEGPPLDCDNCGEEIESAYGDPDADD